MRPSELASVRFVARARWIAVVWIIASAGVGLVGGCSSEAGGGGTPEIVELPPLGSASGLVVAAEGFATEDPEKGPPPQSAADALAGAGLVPPARFSVSLPGAAWEIVDESGTLAEARSHGTTSDGGTFVVSSLPAGDYRMRLSKTVNGNLLDTEVPVHIGTESGTAILVELSAGGPRSTSRYMEGGGLIEKVRAADGSSRTARDGEPSEVVVSDGTSYRDTDGDGSLDACSGGTQPIPPGALPPRPMPLAWTVETTPSPVPPIPCPGGPIVRLEISSWIDGGRLFVGQDGWLQAIGYDEAGSPQDVTQVVDWASSRPRVAEVDEWGVVTGLNEGTTRVTASLGDIRSEPLDLVVAPRPRLVRLTIQNRDCAAPRPLEGDGGGGIAAPAPPPEMPPTDPWYPPRCLDVVEVGGTRHFLAIGELAGGMYEDVTDEADWSVRPDSVATIAQDGTLRALAPGQARLEASLEGVDAEAVEVQVVAEPTLVSIEIYTDYPIPVPVVGPDGDPGEPMPTPASAGSPSGVAAPGESGGDTPAVPPLEDPAPMPEPPPIDQPDSPPCRDWGCVPTGQTVLVGDTVQFHALGRYDTGLSRDLTASVDWSSSHPAVGWTGPKGMFRALVPGETEIRGSLGAIQSPPFAIRVVREATVVAIWLDVEGTSRIVMKGESLFLHATAAYDVGGLTRDVTGEVDWILSDRSLAEVGGDGTVRGKKAGRFAVSARIGAVESNPVALEVWETSSLDHCDEEHVNRATWTDGMNRVTLETDCASYERGSTVTMRYTIQEIRPNPGAVLDPCLDLYVYRGEEQVRTIREQGCGADVLPDEGAAPRDPTIYQTLAFWDQKDSAGRPVDAGTYRIVGRFYIYYDPVVEIGIEVK